MPTVKDRLVARVIGDAEMSRQSKTPAVLAAELQTFDRQRANLLKTYPQKYALIKGRNLVGVFESDREALDTGYAKFGAAPFLVKQMRAKDDPVRLMVMGVSL